MHTHDWAERLVEKHPVILDLKQRLEAQNFAAPAADFLVRHINFAYPRTLWVSWSVDIGDVRSVEEIGFRQGLDPRKTGEFLSKWLEDKRAIKNIVFDLTDVTIFDAEKMRGLFAATSAEVGGTKYYVCSGDLAERVRQVPEVDPSAIFPTERLMLTRLRDVPQSERCLVPLPRNLDLFSLDEALKTHASDEKVQNCDVIALDMAAVMKISFEAHCMLSPIIHSLGHRYGILATVLNAKRKVVADIGAHGSLRPMRSNLIQVPQQYLRRIDPLEDKGYKGEPVAMRTFTHFEVWQIQDFWLSRLTEMYKYYHAWFIDIGDIPEVGTDRLGIILRHLQNIIKELVDNAALHSGGVGYLALEVNTLPEIGGLGIYIGDTGVGLARGLAKSYNMELPSDVRAVSIAMSLGEMLAERRQRTNEFGGRGLEHVGVLLRRLKGTISIRTGSARATFSPDHGRRATHVRDDMYYIEGTHVYIHIPTKWKSL